MGNIFVPGQRRAHRRAQGAASGGGSSGSDTWLRQMLGARQELGSSGD